MPVARYVDRPQSNEYDRFYAGYIARVPDGDLVTILQEQFHETTALLEPLAVEQAEHAYAPGKWTVKEVVGHLADAERVLSYRALRIARSDPAGLAGFEEDAWVSAADFGRHSLDQILAQLVTARRSTVALFSGFAPGEWTRRGLANEQEVSVRALACIIAGHELHHRAILRERYGIESEAVRHRE